MPRIAFTMSINPGCEAEYARRHQPIWPELEAVLVAHGVSNYAIFLHPETLQLFAYAEIVSTERWAAIAKTEVCQRWWRSMQSLMPSAADARPLSTPLVEVFHLA